MMKKVYWSVDLQVWMFAAGDKDAPVAAEPPIRPGFLESGKQPIFAIANSQEVWQEAIFIGRRSAEDIERLATVVPPWVWQRILRDAVLPPLFIQAALSGLEYDKIMFWQSASFLLDWPALPQFRPEGRVGIR